MALDLAVRTETACSLFRGDRLMYITWRYKLYQALQRNDVRSPYSEKFGSGALHRNATSRLTSLSVDPSNIPTPVAGTAVFPLQPRIWRSSTGARRYWWSAVLAGNPKFPRIDTGLHAIGGRMVAM